MPQSVLDACLCRRTPRCALGPRPAPLPSCRLTTAASLPLPRGRGRGAVRRPQQRGKPRLKHRRMHKKCACSLLGAARQRHPRRKRSICASLHGRAGATPALGDALQRHCCSLWPTTREAVMGARPASLRWRRDPRRRPRACTAGPLTELPRRHLTSMIAYAPANPMWLGGNTPNPRQVDGLH